MRNRYCDIEILKKHFVRFGWSVNRWVNEVDISSALSNKDLEPVKHAHWERLEGDSRFMCSLCKWKETVPTCNGEPTIWEYCPSCGAKMDVSDTNVGKMEEVKHEI